jgi:7-carboxy-7-deazaguanine synthase
MGLPTVFIRLTGCPLRCSYCDTEYAFQGGEWKTIDELIELASQYNTRYVTVTGGEPLAQKNCLELLSRLCDAGFDVSLETSGALDVSAVDSRVAKIMDLKTPSSGEMAKNRWENLSFLDQHDEIKFVIGDREDYQWAREVLVKDQLAERCTVLFSPVKDSLPESDLADWILEDQLPVRFQLQLHKLLWQDAQGR